MAPSGNPLFGLAGGNVLDSNAAYKGDYGKFGSANDPMVGARVGGTISFGGGLGLYSGGSNAVGGLGLSGDTACADHSTAWRTRINLGLAPTAARPRQDHLEPHRPSALPERQRHPGHELSF